MKVNKCFLVIFLIVGMGLLYSQCVSPAASEVADARGASYAGASACATCHKDIHDNFLHSAHFQTSQPLTSLPGKAAVTAGKFTYADSSKLVVEKRDTGTYQVAYINGKEAIAKRFDIAFGSGMKAYTFGYWQGDMLYQLPLSYFTAVDQWGNSPGFPVQRANFQRPIIRRCFECHSSYIAEAKAQTESLTQARNLDRGSIIYGIDCERCHGPAADHVAFQTEHPSFKEPRYIKTWASLSRSQKLDACAVCHSGNDLTTQRSTFAFSAGDTLSKFYYPEFAGDATNVPDVHGKQVQLLAASSCFQKSTSLECASCHSSHQTKPPGLENYSRQCAGCHKEVTHKSFDDNTSSHNNIVSNCIDCHMPEMASKTINFQVMGEKKPAPYLLRTHRIAVYPAETQRVLTLMNNRTVLVP